ncbi:hypothetical protein BA190_09395 [Labrys sp. WJW]|uniref:hypothetical protein n=1 Tax=Labrys sp. WJW TaxID=1737983 RepID=UPI00082BED58|nr:hypothetical protein [Labrys sp. WJW]OCC05120.1 hypothetical protein BA190_09395 [Labrys sp. WJW]
MVSLSDFASMWQDAGPALATAFGEDLRVLPQSNGAFVVGGPDPSRVEYDIVGIVDERTFAGRNEGRGSRNADQVDRLLDRVVIDFDVNDFGTRAWPQEGDIIATKRADRSKYEVVSPHPSEVGRVAFKCVRITK